MRLYSEQDIFYNSCCICIITQFGSHNIYFLMRKLKHIERSVQYRCIACILSHSVVSDSFATPCSQPPLSTGLCRQEYWDGLPFPPPGDLPHPGDSRLLHWQVTPFTLEPPGKPHRYIGRLRFQTSKEAFTESATSSQILKGDEGANCVNIWGKNILDRRNISTKSLRYQHLLIQMEFS